MASYVVLARKWRPAQFSDIVGQSHIVKTLINAIRTDRIHQAYLLTGSRGIGKTSIARIFAKVLRCESAKEFQSCDQCPSCKEITAGNSVDVIEIDGASNNGVDAVREIRENAKYLPSSGKRKIYYIDEVHMLTTAAFNALLKTLEEPPPHIVFIFATTEPHKIPATILSRCQRFDLRRVTATQIQGRLMEVLKSENIESEAGALALVARAAEGSMRDALSLLDQVIAFSGDRITLQSVRDSIGLIEGQTLLGILKGVLDRKPLESLALVEQAYQQGHDLRVLARGLIEFLHATVLAKIGAPSPQTLELSEEEWKEIQALASLRELEELEMIFQALHQGVDWIARSPQPKLVLDVLLVKCATAEALAFVEDAGTSKPAGGSGQIQRAPVASATPTVTPATSPAPGKISTASVSSPSAIAAPQAALAAAPAPAATSVSMTSTTPTVPKAEGPITWEGFIGHVRRSRPLLASILEHGSCTHFPNGESVLEISFKPEDSYFKEQLQSRVYSEQLTTMSKEFFGKPIRIKIDQRHEAGESLAARKEREAQEKEQQARDAVKSHPIISEARALFGGELGPIEVNHNV